MQTYVDDDTSEDFYASAWGGDSQSFPFCDGGPGGQLVAVAGKRRVIKIISPLDCRIVASLAGHGSDIYDLMFMPPHSTAFGGKVDKHILFSTSKDESIRLWNVRTGAMVMVFAGDRGHREDVLSVDVRPDGALIASGGLDTTVRLWPLGCSGEVKKAVIKSDDPGLIVTSVGKDGSSKNFPTGTWQFPCFATDHVHTDYVDCVRFCGGAILSKSTGNVILLWEPIMGKDGFQGRCGVNSDDGIVPIREFVLSNCDIWFVKFGIDRTHNWLSVGNKAGVIKVWDITAGTSSDSSESGKSTSLHRLTHPDINKTVRMVAFSPTGSHISVVCENGSSFVFKFNPNHDNIKGSSSSRKDKRRIRES